MIELPLINSPKITRTAIVSGAVSRSPYNFAQQAQDWGGFMWDFQIEFSLMGADDGRIMSAFFTKIKGSLNPFTIKPPEMKRNIPNDVSVNGGSQTGNTLIVSGLTGQMRIGDFFSISNKLYQIVDEPTSTTITFEPKLRNSPADLTVLEIANPKVLVRAYGPVPSQIEYPMNYRFTLQCHEAL